MQNRVQSGDKVVENRCKTRINLWLTCAFGVGLAAGIWACLASPLGEMVSLGPFLQGFERVLAAGGGEVSFLSLYLNLLRWPFLAWLLGWFGVGRYLLPGLFCARGFLLAFSACALARGGMGGAARGLVLLCGALASTPPFFLLGAQSYGQTRGLKARASLMTRDIPRRFWVLTAVAAVALALCAGVGQRVILPLLRWLVNSSVGK